MSEPWTAHDTAIVEADTHIGAGTRIWHHAHVREGARIGTNCSLGKDVFVDAGVEIGNRVRIQNNVSVYAGVTLGDDVFVGPGAVFTNDRFPRAHGRKWEVVPTLVARGASIGANATIVCGVEIGAWAVVAAGAVVTRDVDAHEVIAGNPARRMAWACWCGRVVGRGSEPPVATTCEHCGTVFGQVGD